VDEMADELVPLD